MDPVSTMAVGAAGKKVGEKIFRPELSRRERRAMWFKRTVGITALLGVTFVAGGALLERYLPYEEKTAEINPQGLALIEAESTFDEQPLVHMVAKTDVGFKVANHWGSDLPVVGGILEHAPATKSYDARFNGEIAADGSTKKFAFTTSYEKIPNAKTGDEEWRVVVRLAETAPIYFTVNRNDPTNEKELDIEPGFVSSIKDAGSAGIDILPFVDSDSAQNNRNKVEGNLMVVAYKLVAEQCGPVALMDVSETLKAQIQQQEFDRMKQLFDAQGLKMPVNDPSDIVVILPDFSKVDISSQFDSQYSALVSSKDLKVSGKDQKIECKNMTAGTAGGSE